MKNLMRVFLMSIMTMFIIGNSFGQEDPIIHTVTFGDEGNWGSDENFTYPNPFTFFINNSNVDYTIFKNMTGEIQEMSYNPTEYVITKIKVVTNTDGYYEVLMDNELDNTDFKLSLNNDGLSIELETGYFIEISKIEVYGTSTVSTDEYKITDDFNVYSFGKNITVKTDTYTSYSLTVHYLSGQLVMSESNNGGIERQLYEVPNGIYIINLITDNGRLTKKVVLN